MVGKYLAFFLRIPLVADEVFSVAEMSLILC